MLAGAPCAFLEQAARVSWLEKSNPHWSQDVPSMNSLGCSASEDCSTHLYDVTWCKEGLRSRGARPLPPSLPPSFPPFPFRRFRASFLSLTYSSCTNMHMRTH